MSENNSSPEHGQLGEQTVRQINWASVMGGAYVMVLGWDIADTPIDHLEQASHIVEFMENTRINEMAPDDARAFGSTEWCVGRSTKREAYTRNANGPMGVTNMHAGNYDLTWLDSITGAIKEEPGIQVGAGNNTFPVPNSVTSPEVAVYIRKAGL